ncbi:MAG: hypothetical protein U9R27_05790 [Campylobacterota bacterium]|nr:hypothetical protein [Campylobacterota bacterium]
MVKKTDLHPFIVFAIIIFYAFIEGFRMPNLWSINYYLPSFFDGFYRRALIGTILSFLGDLRFNYYTIAVVQFSVLISLIVWIYYFFQKNILMMLVISLYLVSPAGAYIFHEVGYIDQLLYLVLFISISIFKKHKTLSIILFSSSILIHELTLFVTLPIYFTYLYLSTDDLRKSILYTLPSITLFLIIYIFFQTVPEDRVELFMENISNFSNYGLRSDFYTVFTNTFTGSRNKSYYYLNSLNQILLLLSVASLTSLIVYTVSKKQILLSLLVLLVGLSPLALGFFGWDPYRWYFLSLSSLTTIFVVVLLHYKITVTEIASMQSVAVLYFIFYILLISNIYLGYFDGYKHRHLTINSIEKVKIEFMKIPNR